MPYGFKTKDWMAVAIGTLTVVMGVVGVFLPDWVKSNKLTEREGYSIIIILAALIIICVIILQRAVRRAEAEQDRKDRERQELDRQRAEYDRQRAELDLQRDKRDAAREQRELESDKLMKKTLELLLGQMNRVERRERFPFDEEQANLARRDMERYYEINEIIHMFEQIIKQAEVESSLLKLGASRESLRAGNRLYVLQTGQEDRVDQLRREANTMLAKVLSEWSEDTKLTRPPA